VRGELWRERERERERGRGALISRGDTEQAPARCASDAESSSFSPRNTLRAGAHGAASPNPEFGPDSCGLSPRRVHAARFRPERETESAHARATESPCPCPF